MKIIVDTDFWIEDVLAVTFLCSCKEVEIVAITLVAAEAPMEIITTNIEKIMTFLGEKSIPIHVCSPYNMSGVIRSTNYHGPKVLGDVELPESEVKVNRGMSSVEALIHYSKKYPNEIRALFIGPLTNLALAFLIDPEFPTRLASITILGTDRRDKNKFMHFYTAEFNSRCDPLAYVILKENISKLNVPITIIDTAACVAARLPLDLAEGLKDLKNQTSEINKHLDIFIMFLDRNNEHIKKYYHSNGIQTTDLFAAVGLVNDSIFKSIKKVNITNVVTSGWREGQVEYEDNTEGTLDLVDEIDSNLTFDMIVQKLNKCPIL
ncbi:Uridine nucleosidase 1 [Thelohanellus kitauei]|uniref:Uridine nucleosidase 1 n=1 Tax=Thelohanellus kitauei TaxID=669202 RepID=A0A0C2IY28_THEKT|nr:Uridine nucleosidase 1 [Thelohanellus kitauei]